MTENRKTKGRPRAKHKGHKIVCDTPTQVKDCLNEFLVTRTEYKRLTDLFNAYFIFYINNNFSLSQSDIYRYESLPGKTRNNFSFYLSEDAFIKLQSLAKANLRDVKSQALHFVYSVYKYLSEDPFESVPFYSTL
jgi:hypothetical protein